MSKEPEKTFCPRCGAEELRWPDIAAALESMLPNMSIGHRPMAIQAIMEIRELRGRLDFIHLTMGHPMGKSSRP